VVFFEPNSLAKINSLRTCSNPPIDPNTLYTIRGSNMSAQKQAVLIRKDSRWVTGLKVTVNDQVLGSSGIGYVGSLDAPVPPGNQIRLKVEVSEGTITANDTVPLTPSIVQPTAASLSVSQPIELRWNVAQETDRFNVFATAFDSKGPVQSILLNQAGQGLPYPKGTVRSVIFPAGTFPVGAGVASIRIGIHGINDGQETFQGPNLFLPGNLLNIDGEPTYISFVPTP
jgi:hypothetical protein